MSAYIGSTYVHKWISQNFFHSVLTVTIRKTIIHKLVTNQNGSKLCLVLICTPKMIFLSRRRTTIFIPYFSSKKLKIILASVDAALKGAFYAIHLYENISFAL
jgi:hypothetical protein